MSSDLSEIAWKEQRRVRDRVREAVPKGFDLYSGGSGNRHFEDRIDWSEGYWHPDKGRLRWIFHVVPGQKTFHVRLPPKSDADYLPGAPNAESSRKLVLTYTAVTFFQRKSGKFEWPSGWQWTIVFVLGKHVPHINTSIDMHEPDLVKMKIMANSVELPIIGWNVVGHLPPDTDYRGDAFNRVLQYGEVGTALAECIGALRPNKEKR